MAGAELAAERAPGGPWVLLVPWSVAGGGGGGTWAVAARETAAP